MIGKDTAKHFAQSLRIIGVAQFANYGYQALTTGNIKILVISAFIFVGFEIIGGMIIHKGEKA